jgi:hypothetical protein
MVQTKLQARRHRNVTEWKPQFTQAGFHIKQYKECCNETGKEIITFKPG